MNFKYISVLYILLQCIKCVYSWQYFTVLSDLQMNKGGVEEETTLHSEYRFGPCDEKSMAKNKFYTHVHLDHIEILGKLIVRGWLDLNRIPTCIIIRATSFPEDLFRNTAYNFQICVPRITYSHTHNRFKYYYYEWYLPDDMVGGMNWDIYFFGPPSATW